MNIKLSDHFTYPKVIRFSLPTIFMAIFTSLYSVIDGFFVSNYVGKNALAAISLIYPFFMVFGVVGYMFGTGGSALISFQLGKGEKRKANRTFSMLVYVSIVLGILFAILGISSIAMMIAGELFAKPIAQIYVGYDENLMKMTIHAFRLYSLSFLFTAIPIFSSALFTALNNGVLSALISFAKTFIFEISTVLVLPLILGIEGIWLSALVAQLAATILSIHIILRNRKTLFNHKTT